jgi:hypothetical protein
MTVDISLQCCFRKGEQSVEPWIVQLVDLRGGEGGAPFLHNAMLALTF